MIRGVARRALPRPDSAEYPWDPERTCALVGDDPALAAALERRLSARAWRVVTLPQAAIGDGHDAQWAQLGRVGAVVSVAPRSAGDELLGSAADDAWLMGQFRLARRVSADLQRLGAPRSWFVAVTRIDGALGLSPSHATSNVVAAGVYGLVKTLRLEWPTVFCRAIDLHPRLDAAFAAERIVEELHDPDQTLAEVGHGPDGRSTVAVMEQRDD